MSQVVASQRALENVGGETQGKAIVRARESVPSDCASTEEPAWHHRVYTEADYELLDQLLEQEEDDFPLTEEELRTFKEFMLGKPVTTIRGYIGAGEDPPPGWVENSLLFSFGLWMVRT